MTNLKTNIMILDGVIIQSEKASDRLNKIKKGLDETPVNWSDQVGNIRDLCETLSGLMIYYLSSQDKSIVNNLIGDNHVHSFNIMLLESFYEQGLSFTKEEWGKEKEKKKYFSVSIFSGLENFTLVSASTHSADSRTTEENSENSAPVFIEIANKIKTVLENIAKKTEENVEIQKKITSLIGNWDEVLKIAERKRWQVGAFATEIKNQNLFLDDPDRRYILFAPDEEELDEYCKLLLFRAHWHILIDPKENDAENSLLTYADTKHHSRYQPIISDQSPKCDNVNKIYWFFAKPYATLKNLLSEKESCSDNVSYIIIDAISNKKDSVSILKKIIESSLCYNGYQSFNEHFLLISLNNSDSLSNNRLNDFWKEEDDDGYKLESNHLVSFKETLQDYLKAVDAYDHFPKETKYNSSLESLKELDSDTINSYKGAGVEIMIKDNYTPPTNKDFYCGYPISYHELGLDYYIKCYDEDRYNSYLDSIKNAESDSLFKIHHDSGAGGTSFARRLAYDLSTKKGIICLFVSKCEQITKDYLRKISNKNNNKKIIVFFEEKDITDSNYFNNLAYVSRSGGHNFVFVKIAHVHGKPFSNNSDANRCFYICNTLTKEDAHRFNEKYKNVFLGKGKNGEKIEQLHDDFHEIIETGDEAIYLYEFPYAYSESYGIGINPPEAPKFIKDLYEKLDDGNRELAKYIAMVNFYTSMGMSGSLFSELENKSNRNREELRRLFKIIPRSDGNGREWFPKYAAFADLILKSCDSNYKGHLTEIVCPFIEWLPNNISEDTKKVLDNLFTQRDFENQQGDYNDTQDEFSNEASSKKFTRLISDVLNNSPEDGKSDNVIKIFDELVKKFPYSHYYAHYARFLFEWANEKEVSQNSLYFEKALEYIEKAKSCYDYKKEDDVLWHVEGMFYRRKLQAIRRELKEKPKEKEIDESLIFENVEKAEECFTNANEINPASPYGLTALGFLYADAIECKKLLSSEENKYNFLNDTYTKYYEYRVRMNEVIGLLRAIDIQNDDKAFDQYIKLVRKLAEFYNHNIEGQIKLLNKRLQETDNEDTKRYLYKTIVDSYIINTQANYKSRGINHQLSIDDTYKALANSGEYNAIVNVLNILKSKKDLNAYQHLFGFARAKGKRFKETLSLLREWRDAAGKSQESPETMRSRLNANFYLGISYACLAMFGEKEYIDYNQEANKCFEETYSLGSKLNAHLFKNRYCLSDDESTLDNWNCILNSKKFLNKEKDFSDNCLRVNAIIKQVQDTKGKACIGSFKELTFNSKDYTQDDIDKTELSNAVVVFTYASVGLKSFQQNKSKCNNNNDTVPTTNTSSLEPSENMVLPIGDNDNAKGTIEGLKIMGKIDLKDYGRSRFSPKRNPITTQQIAVEPLKHEDGIQLIQEHKAYQGLWKTGRKIKPIPNLRASNGGILQYIHVDKYSPLPSDLSEDESKVQFEVKIKPKSNGQIYYYAINIENITE